MKEALNLAVQAVAPAPPQTRANLTIVPLCGPATGPDVVPLSQAIPQGLVEVREIGEQGVVNELIVHNKGERMLLLLAGEELLGAKQNRVVNSTTVVPGKQPLGVPVSCIEAGRWAWHTRRFSSGGRVMHSSLRRGLTSRVTTSVTTTGCYDANQRAVWDDVAAYSARRGVGSSTSSLSEMVSHDAGRMEDLVAHMPMVENQRGVAAYIDGELVGVDLLGSHASYRAVHLYLLRSYAAEAVERLDTRVEAPAASSGATDPGPFLRLVSESAFQTHEPVGLGVDVRMDSQVLEGTALFVHGGLVHLSAYPRTAA